MAAKYYAVIFEQYGATSQVEVYTDLERAKEFQEQAGGRLVAGVDNIVSACNWWADEEGITQRRRWVRDNAI